MVKASAGGGGRGLRRVDDARDLSEALRAARSEAQSAFGDGDLILERALSDPRHIEIQIFADNHGNVVHLFERDCSVQRRHQKVIEEAPSPFMSPDLRAAMGAAAVAAARACGYRGAGTVEFLTDATGGFYFLEMNTRLQVEHPVTELVTGVDLVEWQLKVAAGDPLPLTQDQIALTGWAMEARLYAEDPRRSFLPQTGTVLDWAPAAGAGVRVDHGLRIGQTIGPHYDPMLAKIIAHGATRDEARRRLACAVEDTRLLGVTTNKGFLAAILHHPVFADGHATTGFIDAHMGSETGTDDPGLRQLALAAALIHMRSAGGADLADWRNSAPAPWRYRIEVDGVVHDLRLHAERHRQGVLCTVASDGGADRIDILRLGDGEGTYIADGIRRPLHFASDGDWLFVDGPGGGTGFRDLTHAASADDEATGSGRILAPMDGAVRLVAVAPGDRVRRGQALVVLEAMKMEHRLCADVDGVVERVAVAVGDQARTRAVLVTITANPPAETQAGALPRGSV
jgi:geranyl-CoA carboxylase alpha subunit